MTELMAVEQRLGCPGSHWWSPVGYLWLSPVAAYEGNIIELHLCAMPQWQGRWLTPRVLRDGFDMMVQSGARYVLALHSDPVYRDLLVRLGWKAHGDFVHILDLENHNELLERNLRRGRG